MKKLILVCFFAFALLAPQPSFALKYVIYGSGGIVQQDGKTKICPDWAWMQKCAVIKGSLSDFWKMATGSSFREFPKDGITKTNKELMIRAIEITTIEGEQYSGTLYVRNATELKKEDEETISSSGQELYFILTK